MSTKERSPSVNRTSKSAAKKRTVKRTAVKSAPKKATKNKIVKSTTSKTKKSTAKKIVTKKTPVKTRVKDKVSLATGRGLLVLSPFRFPLDVDKIAIHTARFGGVFFVLMGAVFTLFYANQTFSLINEISPMTATSADAEYDGPDWETEGNWLNAPTPSVSTTIDPVLEVLVDDYTVGFRFDATEPIRGDGIQVRVTLDPRPEEAWMHIENKTTGAVTELGKMQNIGGNTWATDIDSTDFPDGEYQFQSVLRHVDDSGNSYNVYVTDIKTQYISNFVRQFPTRVASFNGAVKDKVNVRITSDRADRIKLTLNDSTGKKVGSLGDAVKVSNTDWTYQFDTTKYADGLYELYLDIERMYFEEWATQPVTISNSSVVQNSEVDVIEDVVEVTEDTTTEVIEDGAGTVVDIQIIGSTPVSKYARIAVKAYPADFVEIYVQPKSGSQRFLGMASPDGVGKWTYMLDSRNIPNGEYRVFVKVQNSMNTYFEQSDWFKIYNIFETITTPKEIEYIDNVEKTAPETKINTSVLYQPQTSNDYTSTPKITPEQQLNDLIEAQAKESNLTKDELEKQYNEIVSAFEEELEQALQTLASAYRADDDYYVNIALNRINRIVADITQSALNNLVKEDIIRHADERIQYLTNRIKSDVEKTNEIIKLRTGADASQDTDGDGITDFDEITIYFTDPRVADSDGDGFTDGAEILNGYNPTDSTPEVLVSYESPKEIGVIREDFLAVYSITTEDFEAGKSEENQPVAESETKIEESTSTHAETLGIQEIDIGTSSVIAETTVQSPIKKNSAAIITGRALPNSYATLYVFSTPIVVTVRTDSDGSWLYRFDKELDDGEHQVYVGITDNAGKIVAKSRPLNFIKQAEAYTQLDAPLVPGSVTQSSGGDNLFSSVSPIMLLVASISVVSIGLVLILLGWHMENRNKLTLVSDIPNPVMP